MSTAFSRESLLRHAEDLGALKALQEQLQVLGRPQDEAAHLVDLLRTPAMPAADTLEILRGIAASPQAARQAVLLLSSLLRFERGDAVLRSLGGAQ